MVNRISLDQSIAAGLLCLQQIDRKMVRMHSILATGCCTSNAIENPSSYYTARTLTSRAKDLDALLDLMGQKAQTLKAALTGIDNAAIYLEQMTSVAEQAIMCTESAAVPSDGGQSGGTEGPGEPGGTEAPGEPADPGETEDTSLNEFIAAGYKVISATTTSAEIQALLDDGENIVLADDIVLDTGLEITRSAIINGNGHTITFATTYGDAIIQADGSDVVIEISNLDMEVSGFGAAAIQVVNGATVRIDNLDSIMVSDGAMRILNGTSATYNGKANTAAFVEQLGENALAAYAATQFYAPGVDKTDADFGQGQWYIPSLGELMEVYGVTYDKVSAGDGTSGANRTNKKLLNTALSTLMSKNVDAYTLSEKHYWSSSELPDAHLWRLNMQTGGRGEFNKDNNKAIRFFQRVEGAYDPTDTESIVPVVGDVMYADKSYGSADDYDDSKVIVGVITQINEDGSVTIMNLRDAKFSSMKDVGNFNPDDPYTGSATDTYFTVKTVANQNITGVDDYNLQAELDAIKSLGTIEITGGNEEETPMNALSVPVSPQMAPLSLGNGGMSLRAITPLANSEEETEASSEDPPDEINEPSTAPNFESLATQYNELLKQYDNLINDSAYNGINLLKGDTMTIVFNETQDHNLVVKGEDISSSSIGLTTAAWETISDITNSLKELRSAIAKIRITASDIGNNSSIVKIRQSFTENLINVLEEGADKLTLADMNEASAEYLMLQTRQALAINAISFATEAQRNIFMLFQ